MAHRVADIMTSPVITLSEEDNLRSIREGMEKFHLRHLPVVDGEKLVGLITHRDILRLVSAELDPGAKVRAGGVEDTFVSSVMTRDPATCTPDTPIAEAARLMYENKFGCLPVVDDEGNLVGIVTENDMLGYLVSHLLTEEQMSKRPQRPSKPVPREDG